MASKDRSNHEPPEKPGGEGWLYSEQQQVLSLQTCHGDRSRPMGRGPQGLFPASFVLTTGLAVYGKSIVINQLLVGSQ